MAERNTNVPDDRQLVFRLGINIGDVVVSGRDLLGDGVSVAARLEQQAQPGATLISWSVRDAVRDRLGLRVEDPGSIAVKNIPRPVRVFRVLHGDVAGGAVAIPRKARPLVNSRTALFALTAFVACVTVTA
jgi:class 3 adenylate cyclase